MRRVLAIGVVLRSVSAVRLARTEEQESYVQGTTSGCVCKGNCGAGIFSNFACDTCKTENGCGKFSVSGRWDYCAYDQTNWENQGFQSKIDYFWSKIIANKNRLPDDEVPNPLATLVNSPKTSFDNYMHHMPAGRLKLIHAIGSICQIELRVRANSPYTGLLGPGVSKGLIRLGNAVPADMGMSPGVGIKFPRTGVVSGDFVLLHSLDFTHNGNFFGYNQTNHIPGPQGLGQNILKSAFDKASSCSTFIGLSDFATYSQDGTYHAQPNFPFKLQFVPSAEAQRSTEPKDADALHADLDSIAPGTKLYTVMGCESAAPGEESPSDVCGDAVVLGDVVTTSQCTTSDWGDRWWQVRHQRIEEDWAFKPQFYKTADFDVKPLCVNEEASLTVYPKNCNSAGSQMLSSDAM